MESEAIDPTAPAEQTARTESSARGADRPRGAVREWIVTHDDRWSFTLFYVGLAVVLSIWISLFWLVVLVAVHFGLEWVRHAAVGKPAAIAARAAWEIKLDLALVAFALVLTAYLDLLFGLAGLGNAARLAAQGGARAGAWSRALRGVLLSLDDAAHVVRALAVRKGAAGGEAAGGDSAGGASPAEPAPPPWSRRSRGDRATLWFGGVCLLLLAAAPLLTDHNYVTLAEALLADLHPLPGD